MSYLTSQKYSGYGWLGDIPSHWSLNKFRHVFTESSETNGSNPVGDMLSVSGYRGVEAKKYDDENRKRTLDQIENYRVVRKGQLAVNTMWLNHSGLGVSDLEGHVSPAYRSYWIRNDVDARFIHHLMRSSVYVSGYTALLAGVRPNSLQMSRENLMSFPIVFPPLSEQRSIASFLDNETAEIDAFIGDQEELIGLLKERRAATITQAVTKGAPGSASDKWRKTRLRYEITLNPSPTRSVRSSPDSLFSFLPMEAISERGGIDLSRTRPVNEVLTGYSYFENNDVAIAKVTPCFENGKGAVMDELVGGAGFGTTELIVARTGADITPSYLYFVFQSDGFRQIGVAAMTGAGGLKRVPDSCVRDYRLALPNIDEQNRIVEWLDAELIEIDAAIADAKEAIELSKERRAALISAAVTGKIDVRNHTAVEGN